jgi:hypothetical protein
VSSVVGLLGAAAGGGYNHHHQPAKTSENDEEDGRRCCLYLENTRCNASVSPHSTFLIQVKAAIGQSVFEPGIPLSASRARATAIYHSHQQ